MRVSAAVAIPEPASGVEVAVNSRLGLALRHVPVLVAGSAVALVLGMRLDYRATPRVRLVASTARTEARRSFFTGGGVPSVWGQHPIVCVETDDRPGSCRTRWSRGTSPTSGGWSTPTTPTAHLGAMSLPTRSATRTGPDHLGDPPVTDPSGGISNIRADRSRCARLGRVSGWEESAWLPGRFPATSSRA